jgi:hypothetical protein
VRPLLEDLCALLRRTYALSAPILPIGRYVIGDAGLRALYASADHAVVSSGAGDGAKLLVRETGEGVRACIYYPDALIDRLEARPPQRGLDDENLDAFAVFVEELDHFLVAAERAHAGRGVSLLELELQANVTKDLVLSRFLTPHGRRLDPDRKSWLRHNLFHGCRFSDDDAAVRSRYEEASQLALTFLRSMERRPVNERVDLLRRFHRAPLAGKLALAS